MRGERNGTIALGSCRVDMIEYSERMYSKRIKFHINSTATVFTLCHFVSLTHHRSTPVESVHVSFMLCDLEDSTDMYNMISYKAAGEAIFGKLKTATQVEDLAPEVVADVLEEWSEVLINVHAIVEYDVAKGKSACRPTTSCACPSTTSPSTTDVRPRSLFTLDPRIMLAVYSGSDSLAVYFLYFPFFVRRHMVVPI